MNKKQIAEIKKVEALVTKQLPEKEILESVMLGNYTTGILSSKMIYAIGITNKSVILFPYKIGYKSINELDKAFDITIFPKDFVKYFKINRFWSKFIIELEGDSLVFTIKGKHWKKRAGEIEDKRFWGNFRNLKYEELEGGLITFDEKLGLNKSILFHTKELGETAGKLAKLEEKVTNRKISLQVTALYFFVSVLVTLITKGFVYYIYGINQLDIPAMLVYVSIGLMLWTLPPYAKTYGVLAGGMIAAYTVYQMFNIENNNMYPNLLVYIFFSTAILATLMGKPGKKRILLGGIIYLIGHIGGTIYFSFFLLR